MAKSNFERMIQLAEEVFDARHDPEQLDVNEKVIKRLHKLHPSTLSEYDDGKGPVAWVLIIPTTSGIMQQFIHNKINEKQILDLTPPDSSYDCIYLCSAMVLPEFRGKGIAKNLAINAIENICTTHPVKTLFVWPFSKAGAALAQTISKATGLTLLQKTSIFDNNLN
jgi:hypothetical protein